MPFDLPISESLKRARWKVKIREKESREPPHVTILRGALAWRIDLRTGEFMDRIPDPADVPVELLTQIHKADSWKQLQQEWDCKYPANPIDDRESPEVK